MSLLQKLQVNRQHDKNVVMQSLPLTMRKQLLLLEPIVWRITKYTQDNQALATVKAIYAHIAICETALAIIPTTSESRKLQTTLIIPYLNVNRLKVESGDDGFVNHARDLGCQKISVFVSSEFSNPLDESFFYKTSKKSLKRPIENRYALFYTYKESSHVPYILHRAWSTCQTAFLLGLWKPLSIDYDENKVRSHFDHLFQQLSLATRVSDQNRILNSMTRLTTCCLVAKHLFLRSSLFSQCLVDLNLSFDAFMQYSPPIPAENAEILENQMQRHRRERAKAATRLTHMMCIMRMIHCVMFGVERLPTNERRTIVDGSPNEHAGIEATLLLFVRSFMPRYWTKATPPLYTNRADLHAALFYMERVVSIAENLETIDTEQLEILDMDRDALRVRGQPAIRSEPVHTANMNETLLLSQNNHLDVAFLPLQDILQTSRQLTTDDDTIMDHLTVEVSPYNLNRIYTADTQTTPFSSDIQTRQDQQTFELSTSELNSTSMSPSFRFRETKNSTTSNYLHRHYHRQHSTPTDFIGRKLMRSTRSRRSHHLSLAESKETRSPSHPVSPTNTRSTQLSSPHVTDVWSPLRVTQQDTPSMHISSPAITPVRRSRTKHIQTPFSSHRNVTTPYTVQSAPRSDVYTSEYASANTIDWNDLPAVHMYASQDESFKSAMERDTFTDISSSSITNNNTTQTSGFSGRTTDIMSYTPSNPPQLHRVYHTQNNPQHRSMLDTRQHSISSDSTVYVLQHARPSPLRSAHKNGLLYQYKLNENELGPPQRTHETDNSKYRHIQQSAMYGKPTKLQTSRAKLMQTAQSALLGISQNNQYNGMGSQITPVDLLRLSYVSLHVPLEYRQIKPVQSLENYPHFSGTNIHHKNMEKEVSDHVGGLEAPTLQPVYTSNSGPKPLVRTRETHVQDLSNFLQLEAKNLNKETHSSNKTNKESPLEPSRRARSTENSTLQHKHTKRVSFTESHLKKFESDTKHLITSITKSAENLCLFGTKGLDAIQIGLPKNDTQIEHDSEPIIEIRKIPITADTIEQKARARVHALAKEWNRTCVKDQAELNSTTTRYTQAKESKLEDEDKNVQYHFAHDSMRTRMVLSNPFSKEAEFCAYEADTAAELDFLHTSQQQDMRDIGNEQFARDDLMEYDGNFHTYEQSSNHRNSLVETKLDGSTQFEPSFSEMREANQTMSSCFKIGPINESHSALTTHKNTGSPTPWARVRSPVHSTSVYKPELSIPVSTTVWSPKGSNHATEHYDRVTWLLIDDMHTLAVAILLQYQHVLESFHDSKDPLSAGLSTAMLRLPRGILGQFFTRLVSTVTDCLRLSTVVEAASICVHHATDCRRHTSDCSSSNHRRMKDDHTLMGSSVSIERPSFIPGFILRFYRAAKLLHLLLAGAHQFSALLNHTTSTTFLEACNLSMRLLHKYFAVQNNCKTKTNSNEVDKSSDRPALIQASYALCFESATLLRHQST